MTPDKTKAARVRAGGRVIPEEGPEVTDQQSITPGLAADVAAVLRSLGPVAVVRMVPVMVATATASRRRTEVFLFDAAGVTLADRVDEDGHAVALAAVRAGFPGKVWDGAFDYHVASGRLAGVASFRVPPEPDMPPVAPVLVVPLAQSPRAVVEPDPARDCARSLADGLMTPPDWDDPAPTRQVQEDVALLLGLPGPTAPERPVEDVPVQGGAL